MMPYTWPVDEQGKRKPVHEMTTEEQDAYAAEYFPRANAWVEAFAAACDGKAAEQGDGW